MAKLLEAWEGVMVDRAPIAPDEYEGQQVPGWKCKTCGQVYGTSGLPPLRCKCGATWDGDLNP